MVVQEDQFQSHRDLQIMMKSLSEIISSLNGEMPVAEKAEMMLLRVNALVKAALMIAGR